MGCGSCGTMGPNGKPMGCKGNGGCTSGGCNRLNVFNWLDNIPLGDFEEEFPIVEVSFNSGSRKEFFLNEHKIFLEKGQQITVEGSSGIDVGFLSLKGELVKLQLKKYNVRQEDVVKKVYRISTDQDLEQYNHSKERERAVLIQSRAIAKTHNLDMKIGEVEVQADGKKIAFYYTADARVDFRELIKAFAYEFKAKVEMRQIGARQESAKVGGIGSCGRELCCSTWLSDFKTVNTTAARYQNLSINQTKLSGQCGRLKCCLNYELDSYMDALKGFPANVDVLELSSGKAYLQKKDIFRNLMWYSLSGSNKTYPVTIERVIEISEENKLGKQPEELGSIEVTSIKSNKNEAKIDMGFVNDVGQISLSALSKKDKQKSKRNNNTNKRPSDQNALTANPSQKKKNHNFKSDNRANAAPIKEGERAERTPNRTPNKKGNNNFKPKNKPGKSGQSELGTSDTK